MTHSMTPNSTWIASKDIVSRKNQDGTVILMRLDETSLFFKIDALASSVWGELSEPRGADELIQHFSALAPGLTQEIAAGMPRYLADLAERQLIQPIEAAGDGPSPAYATRELSEAPTRFGGLREFNLEQIETEVLNESVYLDVFAGSDLRLKESIAPIQGALDKVSRLEGITYQWGPRAGSAFQDRARRAGLVAQQVAEEMPELVRADRDSGLLAVDYAKVTSYLVEAIKELHATVGRLEARIQRMESGTP